jgi:plasmid stability protein
MPTLYVENMPEELYAALRKRAKQNHRSLAAEVITVLTETVPTEQELAARRAFVRKLARIRDKGSPGPGPFPSTEEMQREDRNR